MLRGPFVLHLEGVRNADDLDGRAEPVGEFGVAGVLDDLVEVDDGGRAVGAGEEGGAGVGERVHGGDSGLDSLGFEPREELRERHAVLGGE
jgi:hypothetical protein